MRVNWSLLFLVALAWAMCCDAVGRWVRWARRKQFPEDKS